MTTAPFDPNTENTTDDSAFPPADALSYEEARQELDETVKILEAGQMSLDESLQFWERGEALARRCEDLLDGATRRMENALRRHEAAEEISTTLSVQEAQDTAPDGVQD